MQEVAPNLKEQPKAAKVEAFATPEVLEHVLFEEKRDKNGLLVKVRSSARGRKEAVLTPASYARLGELNKPYTVKIIEDTRPDDPTKGSYLVEIIPHELGQKELQGEAKPDTLEADLTALSIVDSLQAYPYRYDLTLNLIKTLRTSAQVFASPELQKAAHESVRKLLSVGDSVGAIKICEALHISKKVFSSFEMQPMVIEGIGTLLSMGQVSEAVRLKSLAALPNEAFAMPHIREAVKKGFGTMLLLGQEKMMAQLREHFPMPPEDFQDALIQGVKVLLANGSYQRVGQIMDHPEMRQYIQMPEIEEAMLALFATEVEQGGFSAGDIARFLKLPESKTMPFIVKKFSKTLEEGRFGLFMIINDFNIPKEFLDTPELRASALKGVEKSLSLGYVADTLRIIDYFNLTTDALQTPAVIQSVKSRIETLLTSRFAETEAAFKLIEKFGIAGKDLEDIGIHVIPQLMTTGRYDAVTTILDRVPMPEGVMQDPAVVQAVSKRMVYLIIHDTLTTAIRLQKQFKIKNLEKDGAILQEALRGVARYLSAGLFAEAKEAIETFNLSPEALAPVFTQALIEKIEQNHFTGALTIKKQFNLPPELLADKEVVKAARDSLQSRLYRAELPAAFLAMEILSPAQVREEVKIAYFAALTRGVDGRQLLQLGILTQEDLESEEFIKNAQENILSAFARGKTNIQLFLKFNIPKSFFEDEKTLALAQEAFESRLSAGHWRLQDLDAFPVKERILSSPQTMASLQEGMVHNLIFEYMFTDFLLEQWLPPILKELPSGLPNSFVEETFKKAIEMRINRGEDFADIAKLLPRDVIASPEIQEAIQRYLTDKFKYGLVVRKDFLSYLSKERFASPELRQAGNAGLELALSRLGMEENDDVPDAYASIGYVRAKYPLSFEARRPLELALEIFGASFSQEQFAVVKAGTEGKKIPQEFTESLEGTGLEKVPPKELLPMLKEKVAHFRKTLLNDTPDPELLKVPFFRDLLRTLVRADVSEWRPGTSYSFDEIVEGYVERVENGARYPVPKGYEDSGAVRIEKLEHEAPQFTEAFLSRYRTLEGDIVRAYDILSYKPKPFSFLADNVLKVRGELLPKLEEKLTALENPKAREHLEKTIAELQVLEPRSLENFEKNFTTLAKHKEFEPLLRQAVFLKALHKNAPKREEARQLTDRTEPTFEDITWVDTFISNTTNRDTWKNYFTDKQALKAFKGITNTNALTEELERFKTIKQNSSLPVHFIPSRGLLLEFSGDTGDTCWAGKSLSLAEGRKNMIAITMAANRGTPYERIIGSCLLLESKATNGDDLIIIRGLNPIENVITQLSVEDFVEKFCKYVKGIAEKRGRKAAIIIDRKSAASTNRQAVFDYIKKMRPDLIKASLASSQETTFNSYNVMDDTYYL